MGTNLKRTAKILNDFRTCFQQNPFDFLYECDIQSQLHIMLRNEFKNRTIRHIFPGSAPIDFSVVRCAYHPSRKRLDIAILRDKKIVQRTNLHQPPQEQDQMFLYWQRVEIAIELKLRPLDSDSGRNKRFKDDIERLKGLHNPEKNTEDNRIDTGIAVMFFHRDNNIDTLLSKSRFFSEFRAMKTISLIPNCTNGFLVSPDRLFGHVFD